MKRMFRYLLSFSDEAGNQTVAEFNSNEEYLEFKQELEEKGWKHKLVNEREFDSLKYRGAKYLDLRD